MSRKFDFRVTPVHLGIFSVGLDKKFNRITADDPPAKGALKIALNPVVIQTPDRVMLIDSGPGAFGEPDHQEQMFDGLEEKTGLTNMEITDVFCSHLHYDHTGGLAHKMNGYWELSYPYAKIWVSGKEWNKMRQNGDAENPDSEFIDFLEARADLNFTGTSEQCNDYVEMETIGGHTEFSQLIRLKLGDQLFLMAGDVLGTHGAVNRRYAAKYDFDGKKSMELREQIKKEALKKEAIIIGYHDTESPLFKLTDFDKDKGYVIENIDEYYG